MPSNARGCQATCLVAGTEIGCAMPQDHPYEHEASEVIDVRDPANTGTETTFLVWWGDDGHAFVGSRDAVDTGRLA